MPHASQQDPCPWIGLLTLLADPILPDPRFLLLFPVATNNKVLFQLLNVLGGDRALFTHNRRYYNVLQGGMDVVPSFPKACDVLIGTPWALLDLFSPDKGKLLDHNNIICLQELHGKDELLQAIQVLAPRFRLFGTFLPDSENAGGSAICIHRDLLHEDSIVTHVVTCQGRDHLVNIRSGRHSLVFVNVHFEPELTLRQLRGSLIHPHWPAFPVVCFFLAILTYVIWKKDDLMFGT